MVPALPGQHHLALVDKNCPSCGGETVPESEMAREKPEGQYMPYGPVRTCPERKTGRESNPRTRSAPQPRSRLPTPAWLPLPRP